MKKSIVILVVLIASLVLAACGGGGGSANSISTTMTDFHFEPTTWTVKAGEEVKLTLKNEGAVEHDWVLVSTPVTPPAGEGVDVIFEAKAGPGETKDFTFTAPSTPGEYQVICNIAGHLEAGMEGKLVVTE